MTPADLAGRLKLSRHTHSWRGDCPSCGYARAFSLRAGKNQRPLLFCANGCDRDALVDTVARIAGGSWRVPQRDGTAAAAAAAARGRKAEAALRMWAGSMPAAGTLADAYLTGRHLAGLAVSPALRFRADAPHPEGGRLPALVAAVHDATGAMVGIHRTYLDPVNAGKALVAPAKASLGPVWGGAVRLNSGVAEELATGEGIESAASAGRLLGLPAWAALSAGNLARGLALPKAIRSVAIAADPDETGQRAAWEAARRWRQEGRRVRVATPDDPATDFNDLIARRLAAREAHDGVR